MLGTCALNMLSLVSRPFGTKMSGTGAEGLRDLSFCRSLGSRQRCHSATVRVRHRFDEHQRGGEGHGQGWCLAQHRGRGGDKRQDRAHALILAEQLAHLPSCLLAWWLEPLWRLAASGGGGGLAGRGCDWVALSGGGGGGIPLPLAAGVGGCAPGPYAWI